MQTSNPGSGSDFSGISNNEYSAQLNRNKPSLHTSRLVSHLDKYNDIFFTYPQYSVGRGSVWGRDYPL